MSDAPPGVILAGEGQEKKLVRDIMTKNVVVVYPDTSLDEAFRQMSVKGVGRLPVVEEEGSRKLVGIISDRHIRLAADSPFLGHRPEQIILNLGKHKVCETMKTAAITIEDTSPIIDAVKEMRVSNVGGLPVVDEKGDLVGIITRTDLLDHLIRLLEPLPQAMHSYIA